MTKINLFSNDIVLISDISCENGTYVYLFAIDTKHFFGNFKFKISHLSHKNTQIILLNKVRFKKEMTRYIT